MTDGHLLLTFDDGYVEDAGTVLPILEERGAAATFAVVPTWVGDDGHLDAVAERGAVGALAGHSAWETVPAERVAFVVDAARERGIEVTTHRALLGA